MEKSDVFLVTFKQKPSCQFVQNSDYIDLIDNKLTFVKKNSIMKKLRYIFILRKIIPKGEQK